ncbi:hypothetical protein [Maize bushy stunt phytoplasma]|uniref:hypothetical protein n=1 Tax=Maize bushy stunt phytoplasma TaxID=202462 RepID=UPI0012EE5D4C|nr:hypothetical protein [Maize bushy stunt phytoplasma]
MKLFVFLYTAIIIIFLTSFFLLSLYFLSLITFIIGILRWVYVLHQLDNFAKNKVLAKECEWNFS